MLEDVHHKQRKTQVALDLENVTTSSLVMPDNGYPRL